MRADVETRACSSAYYTYLRRIGRIYCASPHDFQNDREHDENPEQRAFGESEVRHVDLGRFFPLKRVGCGIMEKETRARSVSRRSKSTERIRWSKWPPRRPF